MGLFSLFAGIGIFGKLIHENAKEAYAEQVSKRCIEAREEEEKRKRKEEALIQEATKSLNASGVYNTALQKDFLWLYVGASIFLKDPLGDVNDPKNQYNVYGYRPSQRYERAMRDFTSRGYKIDPHVHDPGIDMILKLDI